MPHSITQVQPPLEFIAPSLNPLVLRTAQSLLPFWLQLRTSITHIEADNVESLVDLYHQFQNGKARFLMAFRHPNVDDPFCMFYLLSRLVPRIAKQQGVTLQHPVHAHFIYDRGIPLWAGSQVGWLYSRLGCTPIHRGKVDRAGLRSARHLFVDGTLPLAAAPEGATNGHNEIVSPLEPGIAQLGFWCAEDLLKAGRSQQVLIVPIGIQYRYVTEPWDAIDELLTELEIESGLSAKDQHSANRSGKVLLKGKDSLYPRLYRLGEHLLSLMEQFYSRFYGQALPTLSAKDSSSQSAEDFTTRLRALLDAALKVAEQYFDLQPKGSLIDRCRRLEQAGWDRIYREDIKDMESLSVVERGLADRVAEESALRMWHMRLVESFVAVTGTYVAEKPSVERFAETALLLWDMTTRIKGDNPFRRPQLGKQRVKMTIGTPISVSDRWDTYQSSRRGAKEAVATLTQDLQTALEKTIT